MMSTFFRDPVMYHPFYDIGGGIDVFHPFVHDPSFNGGWNEINQPQLLPSGTDTSKDNSALASNAPTGTAVGTVGNANQNVGFWNFNRFLNEPLSLGLDEKDDRYVMSVRKPSHLADHDLKIELKNDVLTVHGEKKDEQRQEDKDRGTKSYRYASSSFSRSIRLPASVDQSKISASTDATGVLTINLPKLPEGQRKDVKQIQINRRS